MASSLIHIVVAKKVNKILNRDPNELYIGTIAPDISKFLGKDKRESHFLDESNDIPNLDKFLKKYHDYLDDDFVMGYYIHLLTDYLWFKYFIVNFYTDDFIKTLDGTKIEYDEDEFYKYVYNDYTNMNHILIDKYNLDLKMFYAPVPNFKDIIKEIPMNQIKLIIDKTSQIIKDAEIHKNMIFNITNVSRFIDFASSIILDEIYKLVEE